MRKMRAWCRSEDNVPLNVGRRWEVLGIAAYVDFVGELVHANKVDVHVRGEDEVCKVDFAEVF